MKRTFWPFWVLGILYILHSVFVLTNVVDVPYWDEWEFFNTDGISPDLTFEFLFSRHNEHLIVGSKFLAWANYKLFDFNFKTLALSNWLLYSILVTTLGIQILTSSLGKKHSLVVIFTMFFLSAANWENIYWSFQSAFHLVFIFWILGLKYGFGGQNSNLGYFVMTTLFGLSIYSMSFGVPLVIGSVSVWAIYRLAVGSYLRISTRALIWVSFVFGAMALVLFSWFRTDPPHIAMDNSASSLPWQGAFWAHYLILVGRAFGANAEFVCQIFGCLILVLFLLFFFTSITTLRSGKNGDRWFWLSYFSGALAALASISFGRGSMGSSQAMSTRYIEVSMLLIPPVVMGASYLFETQSMKFRNRVLAVLFSVLFVFYLDSWDYMKYSRHRDSRLRDISCLAEILESGVDRVCGYYYPSPLKNRLIRAKQLNVSFIRELQK